MGGDVCGPPPSVKARDQSSGTVTNSVVVVVAVNVVVVVNKSAKSGRIMLNKVHPSVGS